MKVIDLSKVVFLIIVFAGTTLTQTTEAKVINMPAYVLPPEAIAAGIDGKLLVSITVNKEGKVDRSQVIAGPAWPCGTSPKNELQTVRDGVAEALKQATFSPAMKNGKPESSDLFVTISIGKEYEELLKQRQRDPETSDGKRRVVERGIIKGMAISLPMPRYPSEARSSRVSGMVNIRVLVDETGKVILAGAISGHPLLQESAREAACMARFSPTKINGTPVQVTGVVTYTFAF